MSWLWLIVRVWLGWQWISAGWEKLHSSTWVGSQAGTALTGFVNGALAKTGGAHPDVQGWYAAFLQSTVLPNVHIWTYAVPAGEILVGAALILGFLAGLTAFFGAFMNFNFMMAGSVSINPLMFVAAIFLMATWRIAGYLGLDYWVLPLARKLFARVT